MRKYGNVKTLIWVIDLLIILVTDLLSVWIRFELHYPSYSNPLWNNFGTLVIIQLIILTVVFHFTSMYYYVWRNIGAVDVFKMTFCTFLYLALVLLILEICSRHIPFSVHFVIMVFQFFTIVGYRCLPRIIRELTKKMKKGSSEDKRILLLGAGSAGRMIIQEYLHSDHVNGKIICALDDNPAKRNKQLDGVKILGSLDLIEKTVKEKKINEIFVAIPSASDKKIKEILNVCSKTGCHTKVLPGIYQLMNEEVTVNDLREVNIEDLLGRESITLDNNAIEQFIHNKTVLVTGGGGSIGSELCRQIAKFAPKNLVILEIYENNAYDIQQELKITYQNRLNLEIEIASVRDANKIDELFSIYKPDIVFHAAAHKHVPLMEHNPEEAIKNNILGTYNVASACEKNSVSKMILISTDKAVNPTNFMGATKRFGEMILQSLSENKTEYAAVRFGNVLGSNGSVIPLFRKQIMAGGPVTITDKRITRFFMTIPEAAQLVLEAGAMAKQNQVFVLDMGKPVKILELAENMIRLSGKKPYEDIDIVEIGLRPGEKLYEELLMKNGNLSSTGNELIFVEEQEKMSSEEMKENISILLKAVSEHKPSNELVDLLKTMVPTYLSPEEVNNTIQ